MKRGGTKIVVPYSFQDRRQSLKLVHLVYKFGVRKPKWGASERGLAWYVTTRLDVLDTA